MKRRLLLLTVACSLAASIRAAEPVRPNFVVIVADDLGWADLGCYGNTYHRTPHLDRLAREGVRFTDAYAAAPVCSPTRAALLTGRHPARLNLTDWLPGRPDQPDQKLARPKLEMALPLDEITLAEALGRVGYATAHIGKWHLGGAGFGPREQGFDVNVAGDETGSPLSYFAPFRRGERTMPGLDEAPAGEYLTDRLTAEAERFLEQQHERPFFLYLAHYAVHIPLQAPEQSVARQPAADVGSRHTNAVYAAMLEHLDSGVGRVLQKLDALGIADRTVVVFTSDNGGLSVREGRGTPATSNHPLHAGKGYLYEGGLRVPLIVRWPSLAGATGGRTLGVPVVSMDLFSTLLTAVGAQPGWPVDGIDLGPILRGGASAAREALYWHYPHYANQPRQPGAPPDGGPGAAIRMGDWKLIQWFETGRNSLYNLRDDPGEAVDLAARVPEKLDELARNLFEWQNRIKARWPTANPDFSPPPVPQAADGSLVLHARDAIVHGKQLRYEPQPFKDTLGYWTAAEDWASWDFLVTQPGTFRLEVLQGCGKGSGGSEVDFRLQDQSLILKVKDTGGFQNFVARSVGEFTLREAGRYTLEVRPRTQRGAAVMDLRQATLIPVN